MPSPSVRAVRLSFAHSDHPLLDEVSFHLTPGLTGLVGANGAGKSTLLRLLLGELHPQHGQLLFEPRGGRVVGCAQEVEQRQPLVHTFVADGGSAAGRWRSRLGLHPRQLERWPTLSPGERRRWQLGAALWSEPQVLLLDEPGNHLDAQARAQLVEALAHFRGVGLLVSHDRALLDEATQATLRLHHGEATLWAQPYSRARADWEAEAERRATERAERAHALRREVRRLEGSRRTLESSTRSRSVGARMRNRHDSDARSLGADFRAEQAQRAHAATTRRLTRKTEALQASLRALRPDDQAGQALFLHFSPCPRSPVVNFEGPLRLPSGALLREQVRVLLARDERLWVRGANGRGKSTLLHALLAQASLPEERVLLLPQELTLAEQRADLQALRALPPDARGRVLQLVHALGVEPEALLRTQAPSSGEARKLRLALGLGQEVWLAALDEPTNHLDLPAIERLQAALTAFPGALLLVTHDEALGAAVSHRQLAL